MALWHKYMRFLDNTDLHNKKQHIRDFVENGQTIQTCNKPFLISISGYNNVINIVKYYIFGEYSCIQQL